MCRNWKLWAGIAVLGVGIAVLSGGGLGTALPLLLVAACPLGMVLMGLMGLGMATRGGRGREDDDTERDARDADDHAEEIRQQLRAEVARPRDETQAGSPSGVTSG